MDQMNRSAAPNPILGSRFFVPDVEAHVWPDGRVYLYGSLDLPGRMEYCSDRYHVFSSEIPFFPKNRYTVPTTGITPTAEAPQRKSSRMQNIWRASRKARKTARSW